MKQTIAALVACVIMLGFTTGCKKESETMQTASLSDYYPFEVGRTYTYRLDSTITSQAGASLIVHSYQAKDSIESSFTDNEQRQSYRIFRYTRDTAGIEDWQFSFTYFATPANDHIEYVDNNLRFVKLHLPFTNDYAFPGNSFINTSEAPNDFLKDWQYTYANVGEPYTLPSGTYDNTVTVKQQDESTPEGDFNPGLDYYQRNYSVEVYAKGVGLIFKDFLHYTWQTNHYENDPGNDVSYGVRLRLTSHN